MLLELCSQPPCPMVVSDTVAAVLLPVTGLSGAVTSFGFRQELQH